MNLIQEIERRGIHATPLVPVLERKGFSAEFSREKALLIADIAEVLVASELSSLRRKVAAEIFELTGLLREMRRVTDRARKLVISDAAD